MLNKELLLCLILLGYFSGNSVESIAQIAAINNNITEKKVVFGNGRIKMTLDYNQKANVSSLIINGQQVIQDDAGIYSLIKTQDSTYSTLQLLTQPEVKISANTIIVSAIVYGDKANPINETWTFNIIADSIEFNISRTISKSVTAEKVSLPVFTFKSMDTWEGAYTDYGGLAWFYLFNKKLDTYGVHSSTTQFWNSKTGNGLTVAVDVPGKQVAMSYSRSTEDKLEYTIAVAEHEMLPRFDSGTHRRRFIRDTTDVWAPVRISAGTTSERITLSYFNYKKESDRGNLTGINGEQVNAVLNTIARIGVIDKQHFGGNSWHTPYGPICLHEQYIAQMGLAINDSNYLKGYKQCLDFYRDNAISKDGRVWARWAYTNEDAMPGKFTDKGFYEAQWGYLLDANPDFVTNVAELYDQTGDIAWVKTQQGSCEKALDWIIKRDNNKNGLVEMMTDSHTQKRGSDWIDIIWASYENAFVNAKLYHALVLWAAIEKQLGNTTKEKYYQQFAEELKTSFNKKTSAGGFWDDEKKCYIHWRDKDGSVHGNNMVTPVNFMAIAYGICDDSARIKMILDDIEAQMQKEQLFFWPLCMYSYNDGEGNDWQFPFPNYENGDIFLSWGSVAVNAYASYKPELALHYVKNILRQDSIDGLAFQRYSRKKQDGQGDDILSGNSLAVVGLYQAIYGFNPLYNRFYLNPHITDEISGSRLNYNYRGERLVIGLDTNLYTISNKQFTVGAKNDFGFFSTANTLLYFNRGSDSFSLKAKANYVKHLDLTITECSRKSFSWEQVSQSGTGDIEYTVNSLTPGASYSIYIDNIFLKKGKPNDRGGLTFAINGGEKKIKILFQP